MSTLAGENACVGQKIMTRKSYHAGVPPTTATPGSAGRQELSRPNAVRITPGLEPFLFE